jgi:hypothetical protein
VLFTANGILPPRVVARNHARVIAMAIVRRTPAKGLNIDRICAASPIRPRSLRPPRLPLAQLSFGYTCQRGRANTTGANGVPRLLRAARASGAGPTSPTATYWPSSPLPPMSS